ncbi:MAG: Gfo/Idh/MocA family oxidoreductase [Acidimicrobiales bacterium]
MRVGLVGAGPWARIAHAPMLAAGPETVLAGVWARRLEAAAELGGRHGVPAFSRYEDLLDGCEAVAFCVPPEVQATMAAEAARRGKAVLLEKPLALTLAGAEALADAIGTAGVGSLVVFTNRFAPAVRTFLSEAGALHALGGRAWILSGALLGGWFSTPWRLEHGALPDLGPHVIDLLDAALGPVVGIRAHGDSRKWVGLLLEHASGAVSEASLSGSIWPDARRSGCEVHAADASIAIDLGSSVGADAFDVVRREFAHVVRGGGPHPLDVARGLYVQRLLASASASLGI